MGSDSKRRPQKACGPGNPYMGNIVMTNGRLTLPFSFPDFSVTCQNFSFSSLPVCYDLILPFHFHRQIWPDGILTFSLCLPPPAISMIWTALLTPPTCLHNKMCLEFESPPQGSSNTPLTYKVSFSGRNCVHKTHLPVPMP